MGADELPAEAYALALAALPSMGPRALRTLLDGTAPREAWASIVAGGEARPQAARWALEAARVRPASVWESHRRAGLTVLVRGRPGYPVDLAEDPEAPAVLVCLGQTDALRRRPRVAVVGTRSATRYGLGIAATLGAELAASGIVVVSGLALGIDGAAHEGVLGRGGVPAAARTPEWAPPVAVVAGSPAAPYPPQHRRLWARVAAEGAIVSESPIGTADLSWRFPQRNRVIAALSDVVVVVESHATGGALHTVRAADRRGRPVGAVPGSVRSPASAGTNALLADGCFVVRDTLDVVAAAALVTAGDAAPAGRAPPGDPVPAGDDERAVLEALGWEPCTVEELLECTGLGLDTVSTALERLRTGGAVVGHGGVWQRR